MISSAANAIKRRGDAYLPAFVEEEFRRYLDCGILAKGFLRLHCDDCGKDSLVAFSCKRRALCPSCSHRRMQDVAAHLVDSVLPEIPYRQFVITFPKWLRIHLATDHALNDRVIRIAVREIHRWQRRRARALGHQETRTAAIAFLQRFGSALQLNPHGHLLIPEGVFGPRFANAPDEPPAFLRIAPPSDEEVEKILRGIVRKVLALVDKLGLRERPLNDESLALARTIALPIPQSPAERGQTPRRSAFLRGFSLHANTFCREDDRASLERLCRYALRPPFSLDRMSQDPDGRIRYRMKRALPDGSQDLILTRPELLRRLASLVPPPRKHLTRYFGLFAPAARDRANLRPRPSERPPVRTPASTPPPATEAPVPHSATAAPAPPSPSTAPRNARPSRTSWRDLLLRVYTIDAFTCPDCSGNRRLIAAITDPDTARRILTHLNLDCRTPSPYPARPPPDLQLPLALANPQASSDCDPPSQFD